MVCQTQRSKVDIRQLKSNDPERYLMLHDQFIHFLRMEQPQVNIRGYQLNDIVETKNAVTATFNKPGEDQLLSVSLLLNRSCGSCNNCGQR